MNINIMKSNVEVVHRSTYQALLSDDLEISEQKISREASDASVEIKCVPEPTVEDFISWVLCKHHIMICTKMIPRMVHSQKHHQKIWIQHHMLHQITT